VSPVRVDTPARPVREDIQEEQGFQELRESLERLGCLEDTVYLALRARQDALVCLCFLWHRQL